jgi:hypothetical protein
MGSTVCSTLKAERYMHRCTRWYLPLLLLPYPAAPVYFVLVALVALTLHAQPWSVHPCARAHRY